MNIPNKRELQQIPFNHTSYTDFKDFINLYKDFINLFFESDNPSRFRKNLLKRIQKLVNTIADKIRDIQLKYDIGREAAEISALSSGKIDKYEYLTNAELLHCNQKQIIYQAKFTYSLLGKAFEKQAKTIEDQEIKYVEALNALKPA